MCKYTCIRVHVREKERERKREREKERERERERDREAQEHLSGTAASNCREIHFQATCGQV